MMKNDEGFPVSLTVCFWCGKDIGVAIGRRAIKNYDKHNLKKHVLDYTPCDECKAGMASGITIIEATPSQKSSYPEIQKGISPTGRLIVIKEDACENLFKNVFGEETFKVEFPKILKHKKMFLEDEAFEQIFGEVLKDKNKS